MVSAQAQQPFRSLFPARWYYIDFEFATQFDSAVPLQDRKVIGLPTSSGRGVYTLVYTLDQYDREVAPEMRASEPYCPFAVDIYQLGHFLNDEFHVRALCWLFNASLRFG